MQGSMIYDVMDALSEAVRALGGPKDVGTWLRPDLPQDQAATWVRDRLNGARRERFDPTQTFAILRRAREAGYHAAFEFLARDCGYEASPVNPEDERAKLQREFVEGVNRMERILGQLKRSPA